MENAITPFWHEQYGEIRVIECEGELAIVCKDIADAMEYGRDSKVGMIFKHVPDEWKGVNPISTPGGVQDMLCLTEQGLYFFLARSDKPKALPFQKWLAGEVLPMIRKHQAYMTPDLIEEVLTDPDTLIRLATDLKAERRKRAALEAQAEADRPKVIFADAVDASATTILIGDLAKLLRQNGVEIGQNRLFAWMRGRGYLMKHGDSRNMPTQRAMEMGLFEIKERTINNPDGSIRITKTTKVTGRGQIHFINAFKGQAVGFT